MDKILEIEKINNEELKFIKLRKNYEDKIKASTINKEKAQKIRKTFNMDLR